MKKMSLTAQVPEKKDASGKVTQKQLGPVTVSVNYAENLKEAEQMFGAEAILSNAFANWRVTLQSNIRTALKAGLDQAAIQGKLSAAKMGVATTGTVDPQAAFIAQFKSATPEKQAEMLKLLKESAAK